MKKDFVSRGRSVSDLKAHLVLTTKYRRKVFTEAILERLREIVVNLCQQWDCKAIEINGEQDHLHVLFQYYPQMELTKFTNNVKSVTSRRQRMRVYRTSRFVLSQRRVVEWVLLHS